jgi:hypothetical protein
LCIGKWLKLFCSVVADTIVGGAESSKEVNMRMTRFFMIAVMTAFFAAGTALGAGMPQTKVEYSADSFMESQGMAVTSKVYHAENKDRIEMKVQGTSNIMINRLDKKVAWILMPDQKMYMESNLEEGKKKSNDVNNCQMEQEPLGSETINGMKTTKNKLVMSCPDGLKYNGSMWVTKDGIMVKLDSVAKTDKGDVAFKMELKNINIARQDPTLFEIPAGYNAFNIGGGMGGFGDIMKKAAEEKDKRPRDSAADESVKKEGTMRSAEEGSSYASDKREDGRSDTAKKKSGPGGIDTDKVLKDIKDFLKW